MTASAAEVEAAQKAMGCWRHPSGRCWFHSNSQERGKWTDRGCPVAVAVADAVVAAAQPRIAAETLAPIRALADDESRHMVRWIDGSHLVDLDDLRAAVARTEGGD